MEWQRIRKRPEDNVGANLQDYEVRQAICVAAGAGARRWPAGWWAQYRA